MEPTRPTLTYDGKGINGPDEWRTRLATFSSMERGMEWGPLFAAAPDLLAALKATAGMLAYEAACHEESGDAKRRTYVAPIRAQVDAASSAIAKATGQATVGAS